ncbi:MAG: hypothetical protein K6G29_13370, partial [Clostridiales bacterium]|nr:hypothetical protein [Clostridiales bacterium]
MDILIGPAEAGKTIRAYLSGDLGYSSNLLKRLKFSENGIRIDGGWVTVRHVLREGEVLSLAVEDRPEDVSPYLIP